ncbi:MULTISPECIES: YitT family protein [unclassified Sedimentibacter]|uniref:YitT family protein n=1 Tax=unclassified Sedimentibacter TaxID=2649220 RepID=UPI0027E19798|nr:YitT family protein [Sedimentibacter sp. MB35-C1]WMJ75980.1 YitT family protein [Sedimentibacter sp. MB35-C1]
MEKNINLKAVLIKIVLITFGALIYSMGISVFLDPNNLAPGGTTGIAIIISSLTSLKTGTLVLLINLPILIFGWWKFGTKFILSTIYVTFISSFFINMLNAYIIVRYGVLTDDLLLSGVAGGSLMAMGMAIVFRQGATTGGTDIIIRALRQKYKHIKSGTIFIVTDAIIVSAAAVIFKNIEIALYAAITIVVSNFVLDSVLYGGDSAKLLYIISDNQEKIAKRILDEIDIGITYLKAEGAYMQNYKKVIMCVCRKYNYTKVREIIKEEDINAFFIVSSANEVFGDGYKSHLMEEI